MKALVKQSKKNYIKMNFIFAFLIVTIIILIAINPVKYSQVALNGIRVWFTFLLPTLFPFFVLTKLFSGCGVTNDITKIFQKPINKLYRCPSISSYIFLMSIITGYPVGAKLVNDCYKNNELTKNESIKTLSFCSNSGPMFILGSVAIGMFKSQKLGLIIYISHIIGALLNGLIYRNIGKNKATTTLNYKNANNFNFSESISSSISSIFLIGGVICFAFVIIEVITSSFIFDGIVNIFKVFGIDKNFTTAFFSGILEITKGCLLFSESPYSFNSIAVFCTSIISFGGISTLLQAIAFTKDVIPTKLLLLQKLTHCLLATLVCALILVLI